ncbi:MAG: hypothetical protein MJ200_01980 [Mycoplasmoidaceae bacterium]|nr:hypothetical protein [Mycoplasmoidaceae bacterium]
MRANDDEGLLPINTQTIDINLINLAYEYEKEAISSLSSDEQIDLLTHCALARLEKAASIFKTVCDGSEVYLYVDMTSPNRTAKYSGTMYTVTDN